MRFLLDTQVALWTVQGDDRLSEPARELIASSDADIFVSVVSVWEVAIKRSLPPRRRGAIRISAEQFADDLRAAGIKLVTIELKHTFAVEALPPLHGDPFDRLLVATAMTEPMRLITADGMLADYSDLVMVV